MFNLQGSEIIIVMLLALVVLGPEKLPDAMRKAGKAYAELKKMSAGFQSEFRAAVDEPLREIRETANILRDSADFTKLQSGERDEKPKSGEMAPVDPDQVPSAEIPTFESPADSAAAGPELATESKPAPFSGEASMSLDRSVSSSSMPPFMPVRIETGSAATGGADGTEGTDGAEGADGADGADGEASTAIVDDGAVTDEPTTGEPGASEPVTTGPVPDPASSAEAETSSDPDNPADPNR